MFLLKLPRSLASTSLLLLAAAAAIPVSSTELTPDIFQKTVEKGLWFIEHFSPYCSHCKHFKPTWEKLVVEAKDEIPSVKLGTVDCIMHGDLCAKNGITSYPSLVMFEDGKIVDQFKGARELDSLKAFMKRHTSDVTITPPVAASPPSPPKQAQKPVLNPEGEVVALTSDSFASNIAKGPAFVKFFAPWCGHCKKLAPVWRNLAQHMKTKVTVAEVNCDDHSALCKAQAVEGYPTLIWFGQGDDPSGKSEYNGGRKLEQLKAFAEKASAGGVQVLDKHEDLDTHIAQEEVVYLLLQSPTDTGSLNTIREASSILLGSPQIYVSSDAALHTRFSIPSDSHWAIVALKDHDSKLPSSIFYGSESLPSSDPELRRWLLTHRLPTSLELTQDTFQSVMNAPQAPLVVIAAAPEALKQKVMQRLRDVGKKWRVRTEGSGVVHEREVVFAWMDSARWADWMRNMYGIKAKVGETNGEEELEDTQMVIADHSKLIYYDGDRSGNRIKFTNSGSIFSAIDDAAAGKSAPKNSEGMIERMARYLNTKMQSIETFVFEKPFKAVFLLVTVLGVIFWVLTRFISSDQQGQSDWREQKGKNGRLD